MRREECARSGNTTIHSGRPGAFSASCSYGGALAVRSLLVATALGLTSLAASPAFAANAYGVIAPEAPAWTLLLVGFFALGAALRITRRK